MILFMVLLVVLAIAIGLAFRTPPEINVLPPLDGEPCWPSIEEIQAFAGAKVDGIWGPETDRLYRAARDRWYCDRMAVALWPEEVADLDR
jgi:hypothetical protein